MSDLRRLKALLRKPAGFVHSRCAWRPIKPVLRSGPHLDKNERAAIYARTPNFTAAAGACIEGDSDVMSTVWAEHRMGGRSNIGWPIGQLVAEGKRDPKRRRRPHVPGSAGTTETAAVVSRRAVAPGSAPMKQHRHVHRR